MPKYRVRLESPDDFIRKGTPHFRVTNLVAENKDEARRLCEQSEYAQAAFQLPADALKENEAAEAEAKDQGVKPDAQVRMRLAVHRQRRPYEVVSVEKVS